MKTNSRWSEEEIEFLTTNFENMKAKEIAEHLNRSVNAISQRVTRLRKNGAIIKTTVRTWEEEEIEILKKYWDTSSLKELAKTLKRTKGSVKAKITEMKMRSEREYERDLQDEKAYKKLIKEPVSEGLQLNKLQVNLGQTYKIATPKKKGEPQGYFTGTLIQETKVHITLKNKIGRCETFLKADLLLKEYEIKEVS